MSSPRPSHPPSHVPPPLPGATSSTPPWSIRDEGDHFRIHDAEGFIIALVMPIPSKLPQAEELANAHLFKAAPLMFEALNNAIDVFGSGLMPRVPDDRDLAKLDALCRMHYALCEALGERLPDPGPETEKGGES